MRPLASTSPSVSPRSPLLTVESTHAVRFVTCSSEGGCVKTRRVNHCTLYTHSHTHPLTRTPRCTSTLSRCCCSCARHTSRSLYTCVHMCVYVCMYIRCIAHISSSRDTRCTSTKVTSSTYTSNTDRFPYQAASIYVCICVCVCIYIRCIVHDNLGGGDDDFDY